MLSTQRTIVLPSLTNKCLDILSMEGWLITSFVPIKGSDKGDNISIGLNSGSTEPFKIQCVNPA